MTIEEYDVLNVAIKHTVSRCDIKPPLLKSLLKQGLIRQLESDPVWWEDDPPFTITSKGILELNIHANQNRCAKGL